MPDSSSQTVVSIVTPTYNSSEYIGLTAHSVVQQTFPDWELIVVDDGSKDSTVDIVRQLIETDPRIRLIELPGNLGAAVARNTAIEAARGRFIAFLDSDDLWLPAKLSKQIEFMSVRDCAFSHTYYSRIDEQGLPLQDRMVSPEELTYSELLRSNRIGCLTAMYDTHKLGKLYMPPIRKRQDYGLWLDILKRGHLAYCLPEVLALYRVRLGSVSSRKVDLLKYNWRLYRDVEKLPFFRRLYYLHWNVLYKVREQIPWPLRKR